MEYLRLHQSMKVRTSDILYVRKVRENEALGQDRDGPIDAPRNAAVIVLRDKSKGRIVTPVSFETVMERQGFVDIGANRYVPVRNVEELNTSPEEFEGKRYRVIWLKGFNGVLSSMVALHELEGRLADAQRKQDRLDDQAEMLERIKKKLLNRARVPKMEVADIEVPGGMHQIPHFGLEMAA